MLPSIDYDSPNGEGEDSLFARWESGSASPMPAPLSVRRRRYRWLITELIRRYGRGLPARLLSIGAGNGFTEADLSRAGFDVTASDRSQTALAYCKDKGLKTIIFDFPRDAPSHLADFDVLYCDGLLGHLWRPDRGYKECWSGFAAVCSSGAILLISNDLSDDDNSPTLKVSGHPEAKFFRPPAGWFVRDAEASGLWKVVASRMLRYRRMTSRRREIALLRLATDEQKESKESFV